MKTKKQAKEAKPRKKPVPVETKTTPAAKQSKLAVKAAKGVRSLAGRHTAEGQFTKVIFNRIGGKECRRFAAVTWTERSAFMAKPENAAIRERYEKHVALVK